MKSYSEMSVGEFLSYLQKKDKINLIVKWTIISLVIAVVLLNFLALPLTGDYSRVDEINSYDGDNPYITFDERTLISAHRAGGGLAPEETMMAFEKCMTATDYVVDIVEFDLHVTADDQLVLLHDHTVNRTSNATEFYGDKSVKVKEKTLAELKQLNFGENFMDLDGNYPYRGLRGDQIPENVKILSLDEILTYLTSVRPNLNYIIEIKDGGSDGEHAMDLLYQKMQEYGITERTVVGTFKANVTSYIDEKYSDLIRSASIMEVLDFYFSFLYGNTDKEFKFNVLQIPQGLNGYFDFGTKAFCDYAHSKDIAVQYWTINDADDVARLVKNGADAIITDNPEVAYSVIAK